MPRSDRRKAIKISSTSFDSNGENTQKRAPLFLESKAAKCSDSSLSSLSETSAARAPSRLPQEFLGKTVWRTEALAAIAQEPNAYSSSKKLRFKPHNALLSGQAGIHTSLSPSKASSLLTPKVLKKQTTGEQPISFFKSGGKLARSKKRSLLSEQRLKRQCEEAHRPSQAQKLEFFKALSREPMPFLEVYWRFGISKKMIERLRRNGLITEIWGPGAIGVRYRLSKRGETYLWRFETAARCEERITEKGTIRVKHMAQP